MLLGQYGKHTHTHTLTLTKNSWEYQSPVFKYLLDIHGLSQSLADILIPMPLVSSQIYTSHALSHIS